MENLLSSGQQGCITLVFQSNIGSSVTVIDKFKQVEEVIASVEADVVKFHDHGNAAAGTRVCTVMQDLKNLAQEIRAEVTEKKKTAQNKQETVLGNSRAIAHTLSGLTHGAGIRCYPCCGK